MGEIKVIGLGPGRAGLITREAWELMTHAETLVLRTAIHPTVAALREAGLSPDAALLTDGRLTVHVPEEQSLETLRCLHAAFLARGEDS